MYGSTKQAISTIATNKAERSFDAAIRQHQIAASETNNVKPSFHINQADSIIPVC